MYKGRSQLYQPARRSGGRNEEHGAWTVDRGPLPCAYIVGIDIGGR